MPSLPHPLCISYANVHFYYGPYAYCSLDKGVACAQHIQLPTHTCWCKKGEDNAQIPQQSELCGLKWANTHNKHVHDSM